MQPADEESSGAGGDGWEAAALRAVSAYRESDPQGWAEYVSNADDLPRTDALIVDPWEEARSI